MKKQESIYIEFKDSAGELRRQCVSLCRECGLSEVETGSAAIITSELGTNLARHVPAGGEIVMRCLDSNDGKGIEIVSLDKGQGIYDLEKAFNDGYSTSGGLGGGLGAVRRLSSEFDIFTVPGKGTIIMSRIMAPNRTARKPQAKYEIGIICLPGKSDDACGDDWATAVFPDRSLYLVADGLGHGADAALAATAAVNIFHKNVAGTTLEIARAIHAGIRHTRGAAIAIAEINSHKNMLFFTGIGNIAARIVYGDSEKNLVSHNGTAGLGARKIQEFSYPWDDDSLLIMCSDGLATRWDLSLYNGILQHHPALIAGLLYRDNNRGTDDTTVLVIREWRTGT